MNLYRRFYDGIISYLPEKWIEQSGDPITAIISKLFPVYRYSSVNYVGNKFSSPWGLGSGWADSWTKMNTAIKLGAGAVVSKTITVNPRMGNPYPRIIRYRNAIINSMGLPNKGLVYWIKELQTKETIPSNYIFSIKGDSLLEWKLLIRHISRFGRIIEINLSCPNVGDGLIDMNKTKKILQSIKQHNNQDKQAKIFLKLSPEYSTQVLLDLIVNLRENGLVDGITCFNTQPVINSALGNPTKQGGLSGSPVYDRLIHELAKIRKIYTSAIELPIFALGGINSIERARFVRDKFDAFPFILSAFLMQGPFVFQKWIKKIRSN